MSPWHSGREALHRVSAHALIITLLAVFTSVGCRGTSAPSPTAPATTESDAGEQVLLVPPVEESLTALELPEGDFGSFSAGQSSRFPPQHMLPVGALAIAVREIGWVGGSTQLFGDERNLGTLSVHLLRGAPNTSEMSEAARDTLAAGVLLDAGSPARMVAEYEQAPGRTCMEFRRALDGGESHTYVCYLVRRNVVAYLVLMADPDERTDAGLLAASDIVDALERRIEGLASVPGPSVE